MSTFTIHTADSAPEGSREALRGLERNIGFIPNLAATLAGSPTAMDGFVAVQSRLRESVLTGLEREVVGITVSRENLCGYSMAAHSTFARKQGATDELLAALRSGEELPDARLEALHAFTQTVLERRGHVGDEAVAAFLEAGYTNEQTLEVLTQVAYTTLANHAANVTHTPIDKAFGALAWSAPA